MSKEPKTCNQCAALDREITRQRKEVERWKSRTKTYKARLKAYEMGTASDCARAAIKSANTLIRERNECIFALERIAASFGHEYTKEIAVETLKRVKP